MPSTRKCIVCNGTGNLWGTPPLITEGGLEDSKKTRRLEDTEVWTYGTTVTCWRCLGRGYMPQDLRDEDKTNDFA